MFIETVVIKDTKEIPFKVLNFKNGMNIIREDNSSIIIDTIRYGMMSFLNCMTLANVKKGNFMQDGIKPSITISINVNDDKITWTRKGNYICASDKNRIVDFISNIENKRRYGNTNHALPIILSFGKDKLSKKEYNHPIRHEMFESRISSAYDKSLTNNIYFDYVYDWLYRFEHQVHAGLEFDGLNKIFYNILCGVLPSITSVRIDKVYNSLYLKIDNKMVEYNSLNDYYKIQLNIVGMILYQCIKLNGHILTDISIRNSHGIVLIDNISNGLGNDIAQQFMNRLAATFPNIQFIYSI
jgi:predicted ATP-binding protein involved in virulence